MSNHIYTNAHSHLYQRAFTSLPMSLHIPFNEPSHLCILLHLFPRAITSLPKGHHISSKEPSHKSHHIYSKRAFTFLIKLFTDSLPKSIADILVYFERFPLGGSLPVNKIN